MNRRGETSPGALLETVTEALDLIEDARGGKAPRGTAFDPLPSLYDRCSTLGAEIRGRAPEPVRSVHHFAGSGGVDLCRCLAAVPNVRCLDGVDPPGFGAVDLLWRYRMAGEGYDAAVLAQAFLAALTVLQRHSVRIGERLVLRDATPAHRGTGASDDRPGLRALLARQFALRSVVIVGHPLDSFLALAGDDAGHVPSVTLEDHARRYLAFLDDHADVDILSEETLRGDPETGLARLCAALELPEPRPGGVFDGPEDVSAPRPPVPPETEVARSESAAYRTLCARLDYDP